MKPKNAMTKARSHEIKIIFPDAKTRELFAEWMSDGGGEQEYYQAVEEETGKHLLFSYHAEDERFPRNDKRRYGKFLADNTIRMQFIEEEP